MATNLEPKDRLVWSQSMWRKEAHSHGLTYTIDSATLVGYRLAITEGHAPISVIHCSIQNRPEQELIQYAETYHENYLRTITGEKS